MTTYRDGLAKVNGVWRCKFEYRGRQIHRSTHESDKEEARKFVGKVKAAIDAELDGQPLSSVVSVSVRFIFEEWRRVRAPYLSERHRAAMVHDWEETILPAIGDREAISIRTPTAQGIISEVRAARGAHPANTVARHLSSVFGWAHRKGELIDYVPFRVEQETIQPRPKPTLSKGQVPQFLASFDGTQHAKVAMLAQLYLNLREGDALGMKWAWFQQDYSVYMPGDTKAKDAWWIHVDPVLQAELRKLKAEQEAAGIQSEWVLPAVREGSRGKTKGKALEGAVLKPHAPHLARKAIIRAGEAIGVPGLSSHALRRTHATELARQGAPASVIQQALGHKTDRMAKHYVKLAAADVQPWQQKVFQSWQDPGTPETKEPAEPVATRVRKGR